MSSAPAPASGPVSKNPQPAPLGAPKMNKLFRTEDGESTLVTFCLVTSLFFLWAVCNGMIDVMDKHFQDYLHLSKSQSAWVQFAHYLGYFLMALPAGYLAKRMGYKGGIIGGLLLVAVGCLWFIPATKISTFWAFLLGVCVVSMGLTFLETIANPYTTVLGARQFAAVRINIAQTFNGLGWVFGPIIGGMFFYSNAGVQEAHQQLWIPYAGIAVVVVVLCVIFLFARVPDLNTPDDYHLDNHSGQGAGSIWKHSHFTGAVMAQFLYVAAQAGIFSFFINYIVSEIPPIGEGMKNAWFIGGSTGSIARDGSWFINEMGATKLQAIGFLCFLAGRFTGSAILNKVAAHKLIGVYAVINAGLMVVITMKLGWISVAALFGSFFFMSIMFPTIFALGIHGLGVRAKTASAYIVMAIMGGAILPKLMGYIGDQFNMSIGFVVPAACFLGIACYGFLWPKLSGAPSLMGVDASKGH